MSDAKTYQHNLITAIIQRQHQLLLMLRHNTGYADGLWSFPMGHIKRHETAEDCLLRELKEELNIIVRASSIIGCLTDTEASVINTVFRVTEWRGNPVNCEPDKCQKIGWYHSASLPNPINPLVLRQLELLQ